MGKLRRSEVRITSARRPGAILPNSRSSPKWVAVLIVAICVQRALGRVPAFAAAIVWALIGVAAGNWDIHPELVQAALIGAGIMAVTPYLPT